MATVANVLPKIPFGTMRISVMQLAAVGSSWQQLVCDSVDLL
jgi:hypothetical protein